MDQVESINTVEVSDEWKAEVSYKGSGGESTMSPKASNV